MKTTWRTEEHVRRRMARQLRTAAAQQAKDDEDDMEDIELAQLKQTKTEIGASAALRASWAGTSTRRSQCLA